MTVLSVIFSLISASPQASADVDCYDYLIRYYYLKAVARVKRQMKGDGLGLRNNFFFSRASRIIERYLLMS